MPRRTPTKGICELCGHTFAKAAMAKHISTCSNQSSPKKAGPVFHIVAQDPHDHRYWLHCEAVQDAKLRDLDDFLRDIWLECCGHMSAFRIDNQEYTAPQAVTETGARNMNVRIADVLSPGQQFHYEYDFGSTTELALSVIDAGPSKKGDKWVSLLARNEPPSFSCMECKGKATELCVDECFESGPDGAALCEKCSQKHDCDEDMRLPIVNSPRMGVCGYEG